MPMMRKSVELARQSLLNVTDGALETGGWEEEGCEPETYGVNT